MVYLERRELLLTMSYSAKNTFRAIHASAVGIGAGSCRNRRRLSFSLCPPVQKWTRQESRESSQMHTHNSRCSIRRQYSRPNGIAAPEGNIEAFETRCCAVKHFL
jgi:hypothetical protein